MCSSLFPNFVFGDGVRPEIEDLCRGARYRIALRFIVAKPMFLFFWTSLRETLLDISDLESLINPLRSLADSIGGFLTKEDEMIDELKKIRTLLEPKPAPAPTPPKGMWAEFMDFITKYKVMGLAVAFIIGVYLGALVQALVTDLVMPVIGLAIPGLSNLADYKVAVASQFFTIGHFIAALITFIIVAFVIFILVKVTKKWGIE